MYKEKFKPAGYIPEVKELHKQFFAELNESSFAVTYLQPS